MIRVRCGYFNMSAGIANETCALTINTWIQNGAGNALEVTAGHHQFRLTEYGWDTENSILTGTMWRVRERNLPSALRDGTSAEVDSPLAEPASFAYKPAQGKILLQYNHHGPRHSVLGSMFEQIGLTGPITLTPCITFDALQRMNDAALVRRIEYSLTHIEGVEPQLRNIPGVNETIDAMRTHDGVNIHVQISLGHNRGGLAADVKQMLTSLAGLTTGVSTLKAGVKQTERDAVEMLDLLGGRQLIYMSINERGRELDRGHLRSRLLTALRDDVTTSDVETDEEVTDGDDNDTAAADQPRIT
jgi:hypothetical protein